MRCSAGIDRSRHGDGRIPLPLRLLGMCLLALFAASPLMASALSSGGMQSVSTDYALDAIRNPALLTGRAPGNSLAFMAAYRPFSDSSDDSVIKVPVLAVPIEYGSSRTMAQFFAGIVHNDGDTAFSVGLGYTSGGQLIMTREETMILTTAVFSTVTEKTVLNPALLVSWSARLSGRDSVGIQVMSSYDVTFEKKKEYMSSIPSFREEEIDYSAVSSAVTAGYRHTADGTEIGVMLRSGQVAAEWITARARYLGTVFGTPGMSVRDNGSRPAGVMYIKAPSLVAGVHAMVMENLGLCMELDITAPVVFRRSLPVFIPVLGTYFRGTYRYRREPEVHLRGGLDFHPRRWIVLNAGGGVVYDRGSYKGDFFDSRKASQTTVSWFCTLGVDYRITERMTVMLGVVFIGSNSQIESRQYDVLTPASLDVSTRDRSLDTCLGVSFGL